MATSVQPVSLSAKTREKMASRVSSQSGNMLTALVVSLIIGGISAGALVATWVINHSSELAINHTSTHVEMQQAE